VIPNARTKNIFYINMKRIYCIFFTVQIRLSSIFVPLAFGLLIAGCSDSTILEAEFATLDEKQFDLTPPSGAPEPPEMVELYLDLWSDIESRHGKTGTIDSVAVLEANGIAIELAQYDGPMAKVFEAIQTAINIVLESDSTGQSIEEIKEKLEMSKWNSQLTGPHCPACKNREDCQKDCDAKKTNDDHMLSWMIVGNAATCIGFGSAGEILSLATGNLPGFFLSFAGKYVCLGTTVASAYQGFQGNEQEHNQCMQKCHHQFPQLDG